MSYVYPQRAKDGEFTKVTAMLVIEGEMTNPNGDPSAGGVPRQIDGYGAISDVSIKRKLRDMIEYQSPAAVQAMKDLNLDPSQHKILLRKFDTEDDRTKMEIITDLAIKDKESSKMDYFDVRTFGFMGVPKKDKKAKGQKADPDAEEHQTYTVRGVMQFGFARSLNLVTPSEQQITRIMGTGRSEKTQEEKVAGMGSKSMIAYGLFPMPIAMNASIAHLKDNFTRRTDIELMRRLLKNVFADTSSSVRQLNLIRFYWYEHSNPAGDVPDWCLHDIWKPQMKADHDGSSRQDYIFYSPEQPTDEAKAILKDNVKHIHDFAISL